jgi:hypothetical protein
MGDRIVYVLCYDDASEKRARNDFEKYWWARIYRIPEEAQNHLFEGVMYSTELMKLYDEWKDKAYVGTISYKLIERSKFLERNFQDIVQILESTSPNRNTIVSLAGRFKGIVFEHVNYSEQVFVDTCHATGLPIKREIPNSRFRLIHKEHPYDIYKSGFIFFNHWMTSPYWMLKYIQFFNNVWLPTLESHPLVWNNSGYPGAIPPEKLLNLTKKVDHYPLHPFINERVVSLFFYFHNLNQV